MRDIFTLGCVYTGSQFPIFYFFIYNYFDQSDQLFSLYLGKILEVDCMCKCSFAFICLGPAFWCGNKATVLYQYFHHYPTLVLLQVENPRETSVIETGCLQSMCMVVPVCLAGDHLIQGRRRSVNMNCKKTIIWQGILLYTSLLLKQILSNGFGSCCYKWVN